ncbi:MAG: putative glycoside hydrolase [Oscillospiraceae bacterium]
MSWSKSYSSYRGRTPLGKKILILVLTLVILLACGALFVQKYLVYDEQGTARLELPWQQETPPEPPAPTPPEELEIVIAQPDYKQIKTVQGISLADSPADWQAQTAAALAAKQNTVVVTVKRRGGQLLYPSTLPAAVAAGAVGEAEAAIPGVVNEKLHRVARLNCFRDSLYAAADMEGAGLCQETGYIWYDGQGEHWLNPGKPAARKYLCDIAVDCAKLGFDEILLTDFGYPTDGKLSKIDYGTEKPSAALTALLTELRTALAPYETQLSVELPSATVLSGGDEKSGVVLTDILPLVERIYTPATAAEVPALQLAIETTGQVMCVPELTEIPAGGNYVILK